MLDTFELKHKKRSTIIDILLIIAIIAFLVIYSFTFFLIGELTGFRYMFYIEFFSVIVFAVIFARKKLIEFNYYLEKRRIRVDRIYSARPKLDLVIEFKNVAFMGKLSQLPDMYKEHKTQRETFKRIDSGAFCIVHFVEKKYFNAILTPSIEFEDKIVNRWNDFIKDKE